MTATLEPTREGVRVPVVTRQDPRRNLHEHSKASRISSKHSTLVTIYSNVASVSLKRSCSALPAVTSHLLLLASYYDDRQQSELALPVLAELAQMMYVACLVCHAWRKRLRAWHILAAVFASHQWEIFRLRHRVRIFSKSAAMIFSRIAEPHDWFPYPISAWSLMPSSPSAGSASTHFMSQPKF
jgi:hypothetical protein